MVKAFFENFIYSRSFFTREFGIKVFRLVFFKLQGITVSSEFIEANIKKYFKENILRMLEIYSNNNIDAEFDKNMNESKKNYKIKGSK